MRGCYRHKKPKAILSAGKTKEFDRCPIAWVKQHPVEMELWNHAIRYQDKGVTPRAGGTEDQPAWFWVVVAICSGEINRVTKYAMRKTKGAGNG